MRSRVIIQNSLLLSNVPDSDSDGEEEEGREKEGSTARCNEGNERTYESARMGDVQRRTKEEEERFLIVGKRLAAID